MKCPRCECESITKIADAPVGNAWEVYMCDKCFYSWRSTESIAVMPKFKLNDEKIAALQVVPPVPPLDS